MLPLGSWPGEGFYLPDPCELTFANTLLLSNAAISLGNAFISFEISSQFYIFFSLFSLVNVCLLVMGCGKRKEEATGSYQRLDLLQMLVQTHCNTSRFSSSPFEIFLSSF